MAIASLRAIGSVKDEFSGKNNGWRRRLSLAAAALALAGPLQGQVQWGPPTLSAVFQGTIVTYAGNGTAGYLGDGKAALQAEVNHPLGVAVDSAGNLYIADTANNVVRKVNAGTGAITTFAGGAATVCGSASDSLGDGCPATAAQLNGPQGLAFDSAGNLYIADSNNNVVRMVSATTGIIGTVAGGAAAVCAGASDSLGDGCPTINAKLNGPYGVALDSAGNLYIADSGDSVVREVSGGVINIVAGNYSQGAGYSGDSGAATAAQLNGPCGVAVDASGNLYIADTGNNVIREVSSGAIQTIVGNTSGAAGYSGDGGAAVNGQLSAPSALTYDSFGDLYIADTGNNVIRQVNNSNGIINTVAGNNAAGAGSSGDYGLAANAQLNAPGGVAVDNSGNLYVADANNNRIRQVQMYTVNYGMLGVGQSSPTYALDDGFRYTYSQFMGGAETLTLGQSQPDFQLLGTSTCGLNFLLGATTPCEADVSFNPQAPGERQGALLLYDNYSPHNLMGETYLSGVGVAPAIAFAPGVINVVAGNQTACTDTSTQCGDGNQGYAAQLNFPSGAAVNSAGNVYIADTNNYVVRKVNASTGVIHTVAGNYGVQGNGGDNGPAASASLSSPVGLALDGAGNLYIADSYSHAVRVVNGLTGTITKAAGNGAYGYSGDGGPATSAKLGLPQAVAVDGAGNLYIADTNYSVIREVYAATNIITTIAGTGSSGYNGDGGPATNAVLSYPRGVAVDSAGNVYIADSGNNVIREIINGVITTVAGNYAAGSGYSGDAGPATSAQLSNPTGVAVDSAGNLYIADSSNSVIRQVNAATQTISTIVGGASAVCSNSRDGVGDGCAATSAMLNQPNSVVVDSAGNLYIADTSNQLVRKVDLADPPSLSFQAPFPGSMSSPQTVTLENLGNASLNISQIDVSPPNFTLVSSAPNGCVLSGQTLAPSQSCQFNVLFASTVYNGGNPITGAFTLTDNALNVAGATQQVQLSGSVMNPAGTAATSIVLSASGLAIITTTGGGYQQPYGNTLTITATVTSAGGTPGGIVSIYDGANYLGFAALNNGAASITVSPLAVGAHSITAAYSGSDSYAPSTSSALSYTVVAVNIGGPTAPSLVTISVPTFPLTAVGSSVTQSATVKVVSGAVIFNANSFAIASGFTDYTLGTVSGCVTDGVTLSLPGTICTIPVTFTPSLPGLAAAPVPLARSAPLLINDVENGVQANYAVALSGGGTETLAVITPGIISDLVGNDQTPRTGYAGDGGVPSGAVFNQPQSMAVDGAGNIYIADTGNCIVRKVSKSGNTISTVAGVAPTGGIVNCGIGTDGGAATSSMLNQPSSVALDAAGNLYIADTGNNAIRMVSAATQKISTVAGTLDGMPAFDGDGGLATAAQLNGPKGVSVDGYGNLYIADTGNFAVREVSASTGNISTIAGIGGTQATAWSSGGAATSVALWGPRTVAVDSLGGVYIADSNTANWSLWYLSGGNLSSAPGPDAPSTSVAVDVSGNLFYTDANDCNVYEVPNQQWDSAKYVIAGNGGCTAQGDGGFANWAGLNHPLDMVADSRGNLYILEADGVRYVDVTWTNPAPFGTVNLGSSYFQAFVATDGDVQGAFPGLESFDHLASSISNTTSSFFISNNSCSPAVFKAGYTCSSTVVFTPTAVGPASDTLNLEFTNYSNIDLLTNISLVGTGVGALPTVSLSATSLSFTNAVGMGYGDAQMVTLTNTSTTPLTIISIGVTGTFSTTTSATNPCGSTLAAGTSCNITVVFEAVTTASATGALTITDNASTGGGTQIVGLSGAGVVPVAQVLPSGLPFAATPGATSAGATITITNTGNAPLTFCSAQNSSGTTTPVCSNASSQPVGPFTFTSTEAVFSVSATTCGATLAAGASCTATVVFSPLVSGTYSGTLNINDNSSGASLGVHYASQTVALYGISGASTGMDITVGNNVFPATPVGQSDTQTVALTLANARVLQSIAIPSGYTEFKIAGAVSGCAIDGLTMNPAGSVCQVAITFAPAMAGNAASLTSARTAPLILTTDEGIFTFGLIGTGTGAEAALTPGIISSYVGGSGGVFDGVSGQDGLSAPNANVGFLNGMALDAAGNLYLSDSMNFVLWHIDPSGRIHLFAGSPFDGGADLQFVGGNGSTALGAAIESGGPLAIDAKGGVYIADNQAHGVASIRYINPATGIIYQAVGNPDSSSGAQSNNWMPNTYYYAGSIVIVPLTVPNGSGGTYNVNFRFKALESGYSGPTVPGFASYPAHYQDSQTGFMVNDGNIQWFIDGPQTDTWLPNMYYPGGRLIVEVTQYEEPSPPYPPNVIIWADEAFQATVPGLGPSQGGVTGKTYPSAFNTAGLADSGVGDNGVYWTPQQQVSPSTDVSPGCSPTDSNYGNNCTGVNARALHVNGLALDAAGDLYFSDWSPNGLVTSANGTIVTDNHATVRRMDAATGIVTVYTGGGSPNGGTSTDSGTDDIDATNSSVRISPLALAFDSKSNLYIAEPHDVRKVDAVTHKISTVAAILGNPSIPYNSGTCQQSIGDGGPAFDAEFSYIADIAIDPADNLYILDSGTCSVRRIDVTTQFITTVAGQNSIWGLDNGNLGGLGGDRGSALAASLNQPRGLRVDGAGNLYVMEFVNGVRKINVSQSVMDFSSWTPQYSQTAPQTVTVVNAGNSGPLTFTSPFIDPTAFGLSTQNFTRDTSAADCIAGVDTGLTPGAECPINIDFTPAQWNVGGSPLTATETLNDNGANPTQIIKLYGNADSTPTVTLLPHLLNFTASAGVTPPAQVLTLTNNTAGDASISSIVLAGPGASAFQEQDNCPATLAANGGACQITIAFSASAAGPYLAKVVVSDTVSGAASTQFSSLIGSAASAVMQPSAYDFGQVSVGSESSAYEFKLVSNGEIPLLVSGVSLAGDNAGQFKIISTTCAAGQPIDPGKTCSVFVAFAPTQSSLANSSFSAQLQVADNAINSPQSTTLSGIVPIVLSINETIHVSDNVAYIESVPIPISETIHVSDNEAYIVSVLIPISETIHVSDSPATSKSQLTPAINWPIPAAITYGEPLSATQLDAKSTVAGTFTYSPAAGTVLGAGTQTLSANFTPTDTTDYTTPATTTVRLTVNPAPVTATAGGYSGIYDGSTHALSVCHVTGAYTGSLTCSNSPAGSVGPGVGSGTVTPSAGGDTLANYSITSTNGSWSITQASSTVTVNCLASVTYNGTAQTPCTASVTGAGGLNQSLTVSYSNNTNVGSATASATFAGDANHIGSSNSAGFTVNKAPLTVTANNTSRAVGAVNPTFTASYSGFVNGETTTVLSGSPSLTTTATTSSAAGLYPITVAVGSLTAANYTFTFVNGALSVVAAPSVSLSTTSAVTGTASGGYTMTITVKNTGTGSVTGLTLTTATLGTTSGTPLPQTLGTLAAGSSGTFTVKFAGSAGKDGAGVPEAYSGTCTGGTFSSSLRSVTLP